MKKFTITAAGASILAAAAIGLAGGAAAAGGADATVNGLQSEGYSVSFNKTPSANLTQCAITNVTKDSASVANPTAYVDIACPDGC
ncbi:hypothetical protein [Mycolicibacterium hodleri]|uniref:DUF732 domain-containing protein n=1 Tax=Mycolicibacterium hodleri TaxID=49897 RepID=A0A502EFM6_9MYCO|nr:hypothetical protein [Mycolicibacterium hodleri]TPG35849.1 hypothetical protein EAH80_07330 [Mycolicibacterium hodleri]